MYTNPIEEGLGTILKGIGWAIGFIGLGIGWAYSNGVSPF